MAEDRLVLEADAAETARLEAVARGVPEVGREVLVRAARRGGTGDCYRLGAAWRERVLVPTVRELRRHAITDPEARDMVAFAHVVLGTIHELNRAPRAAMRELRRALSMATSRHTRGEAWVELVEVAASMGDRRVSGAYARRAARFGEEYGRRAEEARRETAPSFFEGDPVWEVDERLARGHGRKASTIAQAIDGEPGWRARLRCHGFLGDGDALERMRGELTARLASGGARLSGADYYYLPDAWADAFAAVEDRG